MSRTPSQEVSEELLRAAEEILREEGPSGLTVRKVATCAGVAPMGVYNRFGSKHGLLEALFVKGFQEMRAMIGAARGADALQRLRGGCLQYREFAVTHPDHYRLMFERMHEVQPTEEGMLEAFGSFQQLVDMVTSARTVTPLGSGDDIHVAQVIWGALHGAVSLELLGIGFDPDPPLTFADTVDALLAGLTQEG